ncbi:cellulose binding domain-containing protein [Actinoallomurus spadix]|uniref:CBM2 domain-containing protein n=1 Tax=Actinoallomurus spadix TaxID=79912 RepID=A0ABN0WM29_9ACTN|nr:cellulose binding domain-containing protein [Actinoallomurus spadix]MCO5984581.1 cellulose binding domain-containing protein [Actinoallomurus spadix]
MRRTARQVRLMAATALGLGSMVALTHLPAHAASTVAINGGTTYQKIDGFGVSEAFGQANSIRTAASATRQQALDLLFSTTKGAGFSILRSIIPSGSDSIEPKAPAGPSATPTYVWNGSNDAQDQGQVWLAKQAKSYGVTNFYNDAWSAPGFMKTNGSDSNGGSLCGTPGASCGSGDWRQAYANYLVQHARFWASAGLTPSAVGFVNEPTLTTSYSSMLVNPSQAASLLSVLGPTMKASGLSTKVACCDALGFNNLPGYVSAVQGNATANAGVGLFTSHGYSGAPSSPIDTGGRPLWESEWSINGSTWNTSWDDGSEGSGLTWAQRIHTGLTQANLNAFLYWWGVSSTSHDSSLIGLNGSTLTPSKRYYALAGYSRFIRPGATRISATTGDAGLKVSAYRNTDGSVALVVLNTGTSSTSATYTLSNAGLSNGTVAPYLTNGSNSLAPQGTIALGGGAFTANLPARSLVTYQISGGGTGTSSPTPPAGAACKVGATVNAWNTGLTEDLTITNTGTTPIDGWSLKFTLPAGQTIVSGWNATFSSSGSQVTATNASYNGSLAPGASAGIGFQAGHTGDTAAPTAFTLNGSPCEVA